MKRREFLATVGAAAAIPLVGLPGIPKKKKLQRVQKAEDFIEVVRFNEEGLIVNQDDFMEPWIISKSDTWKQLKGKAWVCEKDWIPAFDIPALDKRMFRELHEKPLWGVVWFTQWRFKSKEQEWYNGELWVSGNDLYRRLPRGIHPRWGTGEKVPLDEQAAKLDYRVGSTWGVRDGKLVVRPRSKQ